ncbi:MAG: hypothetical protein HQ474_02545, partial [Flammeovirgaceae bacterium]|nr:hypothetical protein [Flammeovirgaceae bacterium]
MRIIYSILFLFYITILKAQVPTTISYQALVRDARGHLLISKEVAIQIGLKVYSSQGIFLRYDYSERHVATTNANGLLTLEIGTGEPSFGTFSKIDWTYGEHYIVVGIDPEGGGTYSISGESKLLSVPYALHANTAETIRGTLNELDPLFSQSVAATITEDDKSKWNTAEPSLDSLAIASMGFGPTLNEDQVDQFASNNGYLIAEVSQDLSLGANNITGTGTITATTFIGDLNGTINTATSAVTQPAGDSSTKVATTKFVSTATESKVADAINDGITAIAPSQNVVFDALAMKAPIASPTFTGTVSGVDKAMVGLSSVDDTSDASKPISTATQTALDLKENAANKSTDATLASNSDNLFPSVKAIKTYVDATVASGAPDASISTKGKILLAGDLAGTADIPTVPELLNKAPIASPTFTGTVAGITKAMVDLPNVDDTSDANKPVSTATQTELALKAPIASPTFTGTVAGITKAMVDLPNVDDTSDANKPVSTATQTALDLKAPLTSPTFTGIPLAPTPGAATDNTQIATTAFVQTVAATADNQTATEVASTATGTIAATNVQAALAEIDNEKLALAGGTMTGALAMSSQDISGVGTVTANAFSGTWEGNTLPVDKGGTGAINLTGYVKANGALAMTAATTIPSTDVTGLITKVNGSLPDGAGNVTVLMGNVTTGTLAARPGIAGTNGNIYVVSGDGDSNNDGRTYISDGSEWNEVTTNQAATDARYLQLAGGTLSGDVVVPTTKKITLTDAPNSTTDAANKGYVDTQVAAVVADQIVDATTTIAPSQNAVFDALILKAPIASPTFTGTVSGVTSAMVGLGNLDNTSDANKPVSTATQTALDLKENIANKSIDVALADNSNVKFPTELAVKTYVDNATAA